MDEHRAAPKTLDQIADDTAASDTASDALAAAHGSLTDEFPTALRQ